MVVEDRERPRPGLSRRGPRTVNDRRLADRVVESRSRSAPLCWRCIGEAILVLAVVVDVLPLGVFVVPLSTLKPTVGLAAVRERTRLEGPDALDDQIFVWQCGLAPAPRATRSSARPGRRRGRSVAPPASGIRRGRCRRRQGRYPAAGRPPRSGWRPRRESRLEAQVTIRACLMAGLKRKNDAVAADPYVMRRRHPDRC